MNPAVYTPTGGWISNEALRHFFECSDKNIELVEYIVPSASHIEEILQTYEDLC